MSQRGAGGFTPTPNLLRSRKPEQMVQDGELCLRAAPPGRGGCSRGHVGCDHRGTAPGVP